MASKKQNTTLEERVFRFIEENSLIIAGQKVLVAVSGGPDSVCLLHTLYRLQRRLKITLHIAHLNHQLRGPESEADASYVAGLAERLNLPATIEKQDVRAYQTAGRLSLEEAAREVRYLFLARTARAVGADRVAVGHTLNDQVETILLHIIRGTGTRGLRGLLACNSLQFSGHSLTVVRPLLEIKREETEEYCSRHNLAPCLDVSNLSLSLLRNRVRRELLPLLQSYNPAIFDSLLRLARLAGDDLAFLDRETSGAWQAMVGREGNTFIFAKKQFRALAPALQRQLLRRAIEGLLGTLKDIETRHIEEILEALQKPAGRQIALPEGLTFTIEYDRYLMGFNPQEVVPFPELEGEYDIAVPGETEIPGWRIEAKVVPANSFAVLPDSFTAGFDREKAGAVIKVRARRRGDWFQPLGMGRPKKVGEFMLDARIPKLWRARIPLIYTPRQILWVAGWRIDERVKVTPDTRRVLCLRMVRSTESHFAPSDQPIRPST
jgi:tRNA(Ile)-lysidine synthase